jgi:hypothetical protein
VSSEAGYIARRLRGIAAPPVTITPPPAGVRLDHDAPVVTRDGTTLRVNLFRPEGDGPWPAVMCAHPYGKDRFPKPRVGGYEPDFQYRMLHQPQPVRFSAWTTWEAPDPGFWVPLGYAVVNADLRGFGTSDGVGALLSEQEAEDYFDLIEWAAAQPWCTGRVGLNGVSYLALSQWRVAALRPPHLVAMCPWEGFTDLYRDLARPGGIREDGFLPLWVRILRRTGGRFSEDVRAEQMQRPRLDDWWRSLTPDLGRIETPALVCGSFSDHALHSRGSHEGYRRISSQQRWLYTHRGGKWTTYYSADALAAQRRFFDHFLHGADNGMDALPPVRLEVHDVGDRPDRVSTETAFPPSDVTWTPLHLHAGGSLHRDPAAGSDPVELDLRRGCASFSWVVDDDLEIVGPMALRVTVEACDTSDVPLFVGVRKFRDGEEVMFEGSYGFGRDLVTKGMLKVSHRALDAELSEPWWPVHRHDIVEPLLPGERATVDVALLPSATLFRRGDVLRLDVQGHWFHAHNPITGAFPAWYEPTADGHAVLHVGGTDEARLLVPMRPRP